jgi:YbbR domain-containing protein
VAKRRTRNLGYGFLSVVIAILLWGISHTSSSVERGYDIPIAYEDLSDDLVITDQSDTEINIRVLGSRAALRNFSPSNTEYRVNVSGAKPGQTIHEVDVTRLDLPRGVRIVSRSPAQLSIRFERRGRKNVRVRPDVVGDIAEGFALTGVEVEPARVWLTGARSRVLRLSEVVTETIDLNGLDAPSEREVRLSLGGDHVWMEEERPVKVRIGIVALESEAPEGGTGE